MTTNGKQANLAELREQLTIAKTERALKRAQYETRLMEDYLGYTGFSWGDVVDPRDAFRDYDLYNLVPIGSRLDRQDGTNKPWVWSDLDLDLIRFEARKVDDLNPLVKGVLDLLTNYVVKTGYTWQFIPKKRYLKTDGVAELVQQLQDCIDEFAILNSPKAMMPAGGIQGLGFREREAFRCSRRDGESIIRFFCQDNGTTLLRPIQPEQLRQPYGSPLTCYFGWESDPDDIETPLMFYPAYRNPEDWEAVPAEDVSFLKINVDSNIKRGLSDLFCTAESFQGVWKLLANMRETGAVQACIPWIEQYSEANQTSVQAAVAAARDQNRPQFPNPISGKQMNLQQFQSGTIPKVGKGREYIPAPLNQNARSHMDIVQACLRAIGCRWNMPESMVSGEGSNMAELSAMVQGSPFAVMAEVQQDHYEHFFAGWRWVAVRNAAKYGRFGQWKFEDIQRVVELHGTAPNVVLANKLEQAQIAEIDMRSGVMSKQTRRAQIDLDDDKELQNMAKEPLAQPQQAQPGGGSSLGQPTTPPFRQVQESALPTVAATPAERIITHTYSPPAVLDRPRLTEFAEQLQALAGERQQAALEEHLQRLSPVDRGRVRRMMLHGDRLIAIQVDPPAIKVDVHIPVQEDHTQQLREEIQQLRDQPIVVNAPVTVQPAPVVVQKPDKIRTVQRLVMRDKPDGPAIGTEDRYQYEGE